MYTTGYEDSKSSIARVAAFSSPGRDWKNRHTPSCP